MSDVLGSLLTIGFVLVWLILSEFLSHKGIITKENARKLIHISVGNVVFFVPIFETRWIAALIPLLFVFGNYLLSPLSPIQKLQLRTFKAGHVWGTILYPFSLTIIVYLEFARPWAIVAAFLPLVFGDGLAAVVGPNARTGKFTIFGNTKTLIGTSVMAIASWISVLIGTLILSFSVSTAILIATFVALVAPFIELFSPKGLDNLFVPLGLEALIYFFGHNLVAPEISSQMYLIGLILGLIFAIGGFYLKALTVDGALTGLFVTSVMLGIGGYSIGIQLLLFFVIGSLATKVVKRIDETTQRDFEKGSETRDSIQAVAKAGVPTILTFVLVYQPISLWFYILSGIMASALVDTMATEIGIVSKGKPRPILSLWKTSDKGETGVVSLVGSFGGLGFGIFFAVVVYLTSMIDPFYNFPPLNAIFLIIIPIAGFIGMIFDSIIGSSLQRHNKCLDCGTLVEAKIHHDKETEYVKGIKWFNNDLTNLFGTLLGGIVAGLLFFVVS